VRGGGVSMSVDVGMGETRFLKDRDIGEMKRG
jgi:hypothetical protein